MSILCVTERVEHLLGHRIESLSMLPLPTLQLFFLLPSPSHPTAALAPSPAPPSLPLLLASRSLLLHLLLRDSLSRRAATDSTHSLWSALPADPLFSRSPNVQDREDSNMVCLVFAPKRRVTEEALEALRAVLPTARVVVVNDETPGEVMKWEWWRGIPIGPR